MNLFLATIAFTTCTTFCFTWASLFTTHAILTARTEITIIASLDHHWTSSGSTSLMDKRIVEDLAYKHKERREYLEIKDSIQETIRDSSICTIKHPFQLVYFIL